MNDPYEILGLTRSATLQDIKKSYRKLAKKYHPDLNPGNKEAEKKFKDISNAFDLIGNAESKAKFDRGEKEEQQFNQNRQGQSFYDSQKAGGRYSYSYGDDIGGEDFFANLFGSSGRRGAKGGGIDFPGEDVSYQMNIEFKESALGGEKTITLPTGKKLKIKIPAGIESGKKLRFKGLGQQGIGNGPAGDAYIEILVNPLPGFKRIGNDIEVEVPISFIEAIIGGEIKVPTLEGEVLMKVPAGVSTGSKLRIKGKGVGSVDDRGNEIVVLKIVAPKEIDSNLREAVENLKSRFDYNPRMQ